MHIQRREEGTSRKGSLVISKVVSKQEGGSRRIVEHPIKRPGEGDEVAGGAFADGIYPAGEIRIQGVPDRGREPKDDERIPQIARADGGVQGRRRAAILDNGSDLTEVAHAHDQLPAEWQRAAGERTQELVRALHCSLV